MSNRRSIFYENLIHCYGNIPDNFAPFNRIEPPRGEIRLGLYQKLDTQYVLNDDGVTWQDSWYAQTMTDEEKTRLQNSIKANWAKSKKFPFFASWIFDEATARFVAPVDMPSDPAPTDQYYYWQESTKSWQLSSTYPDDGQQYNWHHGDWKWVLARTNNITTST